MSNDPERQTQRPRISAVSLLARVTYADGTIASLMLPPEALDPAQAIADSEEGLATIGIIDDQAQRIIKHFRDLGPAKLYSAAKKEASVRRSDVHQRATLARAQHASKQEGDDNGNGR